MFSLNFIILNFWLTFAFADVIPSRYFEHEATIDGYVPSGHTLSQTEVSTELDCGAACVKMDVCVGYSTTPVNPYSKKSTCWLHGSKFYNLTSTVAVMGSKTYFRDSDWLERPCTTNSDCPAYVANATCFPIALQCLCQPGNYYSHSRDDCVPDCATKDLQPTFLKYPHRYIPGFRLARFTKTRTFELCRGHCLENVQCRTVDTFLVNRWCQLHEVTPLSPGVQFVEANYQKTFYQRTCS